MDDDPFYEIYDCYKISFIENLLNDPFNKFQPCEFAKEEVDDIIRKQLDPKPLDSGIEKDPETMNMKVKKLMKPIVERNHIVDDEEIRTYQKYLELPSKIGKLGTLDYHSYIR